MIRLLDKSTRDKIAAGEVVDRPVSVVKELVENSIDAGADSIVVEIRKGGKDYIRVSDNGCGIGSDETELAFTSHATSKISDAEDLNSISTLGFRGEALASIAAVSRVQMITRTDDEKTGTKIEIEGSEIMEKKSVGSDTGTSIIVRDLFYNTPARREFLRSDTAETTAIVEYVSKTAVANADIRFRMISNENTLFTTPGRGDRLSAIYTIYGKTITKSLVPVKMEEQGLSIEGYISNTGESRPNRKSQIYFVNNRLVRSRTMEEGISRAYNERLFPGRFPIAYVFLEVDPKDIDVNIHPNKQEVRFNNDLVIEDFICRAAKDALTLNDAAPFAKAKEPPKIRNIFKERPSRSNTGYTVELHEDKRVNIPIEEVKTEQININELSSIREPAIEYKAEVSKRFDFTELQVIGTVFSTYIIGAMDDAFYLVDQHAAHERIFYEKLMQEFDSSEKHRQTLMIPIMIDIPAMDSDSIENILDALTKMGFAIGSFGGNTYRITEIPMYMKYEEADLFVRDFVSGGNYKSDKTINDIATRACKSAVKGGEKLPYEAIIQLLKDLQECENPYSCPHGRPTYVKYSKSEIERMFRR